MRPDAPGPEADGPSISVELVSRERTADPAIWSIAWDVRNLAPDPLLILGAWLPHGRFRSPRQVMDPPLSVAPNEPVRLNFVVQSQEPAGTIVENCFVILHVEKGGTEWQVFARITVTFDAEGAPQPETVLVTAQRTGFSHNT